MRIFQIALLLLICTLGANAQSWEKVYQNDANGNPLF